MSATPTSPMTFDWPTALRRMSEIALIASGAEDPPRPDRPSVPVTRHDLNDRRSVRRLPGHRRRPNAEAVHWIVGVGDAHVSFTRSGDSPGNALRSLRGSVSNSLKGLV